MLKHCPKCDQDLPPSEFGVNRYYLTVGARDGLSIYCKLCNRSTMATHRQRIRTLQGAQIVIRKRCKKAPAIYRMGLEPFDRVRLAYQRGITDRKELRRVTHIRWDKLCDIIAELNEQKVIKFDRERKIFIAA